MSNNYAITWQVILWYVSLGKRHLAGSAQKPAYFVPNDFLDTTTPEAVATALAGQPGGSGTVVVDGFLAWYFLRP